MKSFQNRNSSIPHSAFTRIELLASIIVIIALACMLLANYASVRKERLPRQCVNNLKNVGLAFRIWSTDCSDNFPMARSTNHGGTMEYTAVWQHFLVLSNEISEPKHLICSATKTVAAQSWQSLRDQNINYFLGITAEETYPQSFLSGDDGFLIANNNPSSNKVAVTSESDMAYPRSVHHATGNIAFGDGSVQRLSQPRLREQLRNTGLATNILLLPEKR